MIRGRRGADRLTGLAGDDCLFGNQGRDRASGGGGDDLIRGGAGNDTLKGGPGADTLACGQGRRDSAVPRQGRHGSRLRARPPRLTAPPVNRLRPMKQLADGVWQLSGFPPNSINVFVIEDVLIDASTRYATRRILRQVDDHDLAAHALTHAHPDHQGASHNVCEQPRHPVLGRRGRRRRRRESRADRRAPARPLHRPAVLQDLHRPRPPGRPQAGRGRRGRPASRSFTSPATRPDTSPSGASPTASWSPATSSTAPNAFTGIPGLRLPYDFFTPDPAENRRSAKRLGLLEPKLVLLGHGPPYRDTKKFVDFCAALPD